MSKILITSATSAKAYEVQKNIIAESILLGDYTPLPAFMLQSGKMLQLPSPVQDTYPHLMLALCLDNGIDKLYLLQLAEAEALAPARQLFAEYGIELISAL